MKQIKLPSINISQILNEIGDFIITKTLEFKYKGGVIGLSGGVDSTVTAYIAKFAFDKYNQNNQDKLELVGFILPSRINNATETSDGENVAKKLGIRYEVIDLNQAIRAFKNTNSETFDSSYQLGNMISRIRAVVLNTKAMFENKIVLGTGNFDEDFAVGYYTLFGDGAVHISPIGKLHKRLVKQIAREAGFAEIADKEPTAGLELNQTDFFDLGYSYETAEMVIEGVLQGIAWEELEHNTQVQEAIEEDMKKYKRAFGKTKFSSTRQLIDDIKRRNSVAKQKSSLISPALPDITLNY